MSVILNDLDKEQLSAVKDLENPCRIISGPGSGKTRVITSKFIYLIEQGIDPTNILLLTFSNKASDELRKRITSYYEIQDKPKDSSSLNISTIHSFCKNVIDDYASLFQSKISATTVLNEVAQGAFILSFIEDFGYFSKVSASKDVFSSIIPYFNKIADEYLDSTKIYSHLREKLNNLFDEYQKNPAKKKDISYAVEEIKDLINLNALYPIYSKQLRTKLLIDFSHLQRFLFDELNNNKVLLQALQDQYKYILIDEFQDTSFLQWQIILKIASPEFKISVCGDDDQSLYRFRGATVNNFLTFSDNIPKQSTNYILNKNYRSFTNIIENSQALIKNNHPYRFFGKNSQPVKTEEGNVFVFSSENPEREAMDIVNLISHFKSNHLISDYSEIAILFRSVINEATPLINLLRTYKIPYRVIGIDKLVSFTISSFISIWDFCSGYEDIINLDNSFFSFSKDEIHQIGGNLNVKYIEGLERKNPNKNNYRYLLHLINLKTKLKNKEIKSNVSLLYDILEPSEYFHEIINRNEFQTITELAYISNIIFDFDTAYQRTDPFLLSHIFRNLQIKGDEEILINHETGLLNIMTIHQSKGLEFPIVFMPYQIINRKHKDDWKHINDLFHYETNDQNVINNIDGRKVFYVGMTRAEKGLFISYPENIPWGKKTRKSKRSEYIEQLPNTINDYGKIIDNLSYLNIKNTAIPSFKSERLILNYSKIQTYIECGRKYNLLYNMKFATILRAQTSFGLSLHRCLDEIHKNYLTQQKTQYTIPEVEKIVNENWIEITYKKRETESLKQTAIQYILKYIIKNRGSFKDIYSSEQHFSLTDNSNNYELNGIIDLICKINDEFILVDFKASKTDIPRYRDQMLLYAYAFNKLKGTVIHKLRLYSISENIASEFTFEKNELDGFEMKIKTLINQIRQSKFESNFGEHCNNCQFYNFCYK